MQICAFGSWDRKHGVQGGNDIADIACMQSVLADTVYSGNYRLTNV